MITFRFCSKLKSMIDLVINKLIVRLNKVLIYCKNCCFKVKVEKCCDK